MVAVDPRVIPLGSVVYVSGYHDNLLPPSGFLGKATDTGGAIKGDRVDIFINAAPVGISDFGVQNVTVYVLGQ
jgi:3D (Asp-Asp-Asp) domain-containing protein